MGAGRCRGCGEERGDLCAVRRFRLADLPFELRARRTNRGRDVWLPIKALVCRQVNLVYHPMCFGEVCAETRSLPRGV